MKINSSGNITGTSSSVYSISESASRFAGTKRAFRGLPGNITLSFEERDNGARNSRVYSADGIGFPTFSKVISIVTSEMDLR